MHNCRYLGMSIDVQYDLRTLAEHLLMQHAVCLFNPKCSAQRRLRSNRSLDREKMIICLLCPYKADISSPANPRC